ncbi:MAG: cellulase family glycosylhydrolase [Chloroflexota bacterium]
MSVRRITLSLLILLTSLVLPAATSAPAQSAADFVTVQGKQLIYKGQPIKLKGINFYPKDQPWADMWTQWNGQDARRDLSRASEIGINTVRVLVPYKPQNGWTKKDTGAVDPVYLNELQQFVQMAGELQMKVIIALFDFYDPGTDPLPPAEVEARNNLYLQGIVPTFANDDRVLAWDLHNEPDQYESWRDDNKQADFIAWMDRVAAEIRRLDHNHLVTVGMSAYNSLFIADNTGQPYPDEPARGRVAADISDFLSFHSYNAGNIDWQINYIEAHSQKPIVLQETGWPSGPPCTEPEYTEEQQTLLYKLMLEGAQAHDLAGVLNWQLWDFQPGASMGAGRESHEDFFGLLRRDGTWKPAMQLFRDGWPGPTSSATAPLLPSQVTSNLPLTVQPKRPAPTDPNYVPPIYFPETGHYINGVFQNYWTRFGGLEIFGYPLTEQRLEGNYWVQYFERARFEFHPEYQKKDPNWGQLDKVARLRLQIQLSLLGADLVSQRTAKQGYPAIEPSALTPGATFFPETGHSISGRLGEYWQQHNGLINFGYPLSEPLLETSPLDGKQYTIQYFERTRLELHPENAGTAYEVLLGQMGRELLQSKGCR